MENEFIEQEVPLVGIGVMTDGWYTLQREVFVLYKKSNRQPEQLLLCVE